MALFIKLIFNEPWLDRWKFCFNLCMWVCACMFMCVSVCTCTCEWLYVSMCVCLCTCAWVCVCIQHARGSQETTLAVASSHSLWVSSLLCYSVCVAIWPRNICRSAIISHHFTVKPLELQTHEPRSSCMLGILLSETSPWPCLFFLPFLSSWEEAPLCIHFSCMVGTKRDWSLF